MKNILSYKGYYAEIKFDEEERILTGKIEGITDLINFESDSAKEIENEFRLAVDDYLSFCRDVGKEPEKPFKGNFNIRISPELHKQAFCYAKKENISLNALVEKSVQNYVCKENTIPSMTVNVYQYPKATSSFNQFTTHLTENLITNKTSFDAIN